MCLAYLKQISMYEAYVLVRTVQINMHVGRTNDRMHTANLTVIVKTEINPNTRQLTIHFLYHKDRRRLHYEEQ
jgi:hypothetical protein